MFSAETSKKKKKPQKINLVQMETEKNLPPQVKPGKPPYEQQVEKAEEPEAQGLERLKKKEY